MVHPWHDIPLGDNYEEYVTAVVEIPRGSKNKYELCKTTGLLRVDRVLYSAVHYPANYGFIPRTYCEDDDPLDILILGQEPVHPFSLIDCRVIGVMHMEDDNEADDKLISVHVNDPAYSHLWELEEIPTHVLNELRRFFEDYKKLEKKRVVVEKFEGRKKALAVLEQSIKDYQAKFPTK